MRWALLLVLLSGCAGPDPGSTPLARPDRAEFAAKVLPILVERCANPSCHGRPERALSLYAPQRFRIDPRWTWLDGPLTAEELEHDYRAVAALIDPGDPESSLVLTKALARTWHGGGAVLEPDDDAHRAIRTWIAEARR